MKKSFLLIILLLSTFSLFSQQSVKTYSTNIVPRNAPYGEGIYGQGYNNGFSGTVDFKYAFADCFGDAQMLYMYENVRIDYFFYNGTKYYPQDLELSSFNDYLLSPDFLITVHEDDGDLSFVMDFDKECILTYVLKDQLVGCYGQTHKIGLAKDLNLSQLTVSSGVAYFHYNSLLIDLIKCKEKPEECEEETTGNKDLDDFLKDPSQDELNINISIQFVGGQATFDVGAEYELQKLFTFLYANNMIDAELKGHTSHSAEWDDNDNYNLSVQRAKAVYDYLVRLGISPSRLSYRGFGYSRMIFPNPITDNQHAANRRVEVVFQKNNSQINQNSNTNSNTTPSKKEEIDYWNTPTNTKTTPSPAKEKSYWD